VKRLLPVLFGVVCAAAVAAPGFAQARHRVVILGFDGVDAGIVERQIAAGKLPNLAAVRKQGGFTPLLPPVPAQTPVSWASSRQARPRQHAHPDFLEARSEDADPDIRDAEEGRRSSPWRGQPWLAPAALVLLTPPAALRAPVG
jgi:hypothetical protein